MIKVKVCGLMGEEDLEMAAGADYLGFVVGTGTRRSLTIARAGELIAKAPKPTVVVTTSADPGFLVNMARELRPHALQLNGPVRSGDIHKIATEAGCQVWAVCHVGNGTDSVPAEAVRHADAVVLDTPSQQGGGEGIVHDWSRSAVLRGQVAGKPVALAGGLTPENVAEAIAKVRPDMVDVSSGVERNGRKDRMRINEFITAVRRCQ